MKTRTVFLSFLLAAALFLGFAAASGGDANDPLISLDYLERIFAPGAEQAVQEKIDASGRSVYNTVLAKWLSVTADTSAAGSVLPSADTTASGAYSSRWDEARMKQGDILSCFTGAQLLPLSGGASVQFASGAVIDVTTGTELLQGELLLPRHRYLVAEDTAAFFTVTSRTAVFDACGRFYLTPSASGPDYFSIASSLKALNLFRGSNTGYGEGFDLEQEPTRIQALVMLIRMLGEENAALACTSPSPFTDISEQYWARPYVAYAYERGYTNGVEGGRFAPDRTASMAMYVEFVLRALGYSDTTQTDISTAAGRALSAGVITYGEKAALETNTFLRADIAYLSWYALEARLPDGTPLHQKLENAGVFSAADYQTIRSLETSGRL